MSGRLRRLILPGALIVGAGLAINRYRKRDNEEMLDDPDSLVFVPPTRSASVSRLESEKFDILIIGGGSTGTGCALDAASRGLHTACIDAGDWASGTSSKSTKLVHGGVRYLEKAVKEFDLAQYRLVKEALEERKRVLKIAPHLTDTLPIMLPLYNIWSAPYYWIGTKTYDMIAGGYQLLPSYTIGRERALVEFPLLKRQGLLGAIVYYDGQQDDARMNVALALTSMRYGAAVCNYIETRGLLKDEHGRICGARVIDRISNKEFNVKAKVVINATGPYCDSIRTLDDPNCIKMIQASSGVHITLPEYYSPRAMGLIDPATKDQRVIFFLPWQHNSLAGTTEAPTHQVNIYDEPEARQQDIDYILDELNSYLDTEVKMRRCDVQSCWAGLRPLVTDVSKKSTASIVRNHLIITSDSGLITVTGGKWTTYRRMAEETIDLAIQQAGMELNNYQSMTRSIRLIGAQGYSPLLYIKLIQQFGYETDVAKHLAASYGDRSIGIALLEQESDKRWPVSGKRLVAWYPYTESEVKWAVRHEYAMRPMDILCRRTRLAFHNCRSALDALPRVCDIMAEELGWSKEERAEHEKEAKKMLGKMGLNSLLINRTESTSDQLKLLRKEFGEISVNGHVKYEEAARMLGPESVRLPRNKYTSLAEYLEVIHE